MMEEPEIKKEKRLLAAIMFTDMVGYTALMQNDEKQAKKNRDRHREVQSNATSRYSGEILQYYGDGTLIIFRSAIQAVSCAVELQTELQKEPVIPLRIGLHIGDIVYDDEGIYGDGVNIASRIENLSTSGSILISGKMMDEIKNQPQFSTKQIGAFNLKNVKRPVRVFAISNEGLNIPEINNLNSQLNKHKESIAVLPFVSMSSDPENEYFSDGITEELLNALTKVEGLQVTARTSSFAFKGKNIDIREIGNQLGVKTILEGSVRKSGNKVRITAQLINVADGYHIWSETYDRQFKDIFEIQDEISLKIVNRLRKKFSIDSSKKLVIPSTNNLEAYNLYLKAIFHQSNWNITGTQIAIKLLKEAIELDPMFAKAYAELSIIYEFMGRTRMTTFPEDSYQKSKEYVSQANKIEKNLPESHLAMANYSYYRDFNYIKAKKHINEAIKLNPSYAEAYFSKAMFLVAFNKLKEANLNIQIALQLDPFSLPQKMVHAFILKSRGKETESILILDEISEKNQDFPYVKYLKALMAFDNNDFVRSRSLIEEIKNSPIFIAEYNWIMGMICIKKKKSKMEKKYLDKLMEMNKKPNFTAFFYTGILFGLSGDKDKMYKYLNKSIDARETDIIYINQYKVLEPFYKDKRYLEILKKMNLIPIQSASK